jgi:integrase
MAKVNFNLKDPNAKKDTPILMIIRWCKKRLVIYTRESIHPKHWQSDKNKRNYQRAKNSLEGHAEFNRRLANMQNTAMNAYWEFKNNHEHQEPTKEELGKLVKQKLELDKPEDKNYNLLEFFELRKEEERKRIQSLGKKVDNKTQTYSYQQTQKKLEDYAEYKNKRMDFDSIDLDFYYDFVEYLEKVEKFSINNIGKHIKNLKAILNEATERGINTNMTYKSRKFKVLREEVPNIYLNEKELKDLFELDFNSKKVKEKGLKKKHERARHLFLVGCYTGLRFSDLTNIKTKNFTTMEDQGEKFDALVITMQKTGKRIPIPVHPIVKEIREKYKDVTENSFPPKISNQKLNEYLKDICKVVESLKKEEEVILTREGQKVSKMVPKHDLITTHTARRSFATNMYHRGLGTVTIMNITGHTTESAFLKYIKATPADHAGTIYRNWQQERKPLKRVK